jgi:hypothetical protein
MRSYFILSPGAQRPQDFKWYSAPRLIGINELSDAAKQVMSGLLFRVRSEQAPGATLSADDFVEACVGVVDATVRWRVALSLARGMLASLRIPSVAEACWQGYGMLAKNPATISAGERNAAVEALRAAVEPLSGNTAQNIFESSVAHGMQRLIMCDNDAEAYGAMPFTPCLSLNIDHTKREQSDARATTVDILTSSVLITESLGRLAEKMPEWFTAVMPKLPTAAPSRRQEPEASDDEDDDSET